MLRWKSRGVTPPRRSSTTPPSYFPGGRCSARCRSRSPAANTGRFSARTGPARRRCSRCSLQSAIRRPASWRSSASVSATSTCGSCVDRSASSATASPTACPRWRRPSRSSSPAGTDSSRRWWGRFDGPARREALATLRRVGCDQLADQPFGQCSQGERQRGPGREVASRTARVAVARRAGAWRRPSRAGGADRGARRARGAGGPTTVHVADTLEELSGLTTHAMLISAACCCFGVVAEVLVDEVLSECSARRLRWNGEAGATRASCGLLVVAVDRRSTPIVADGVHSRDGCRRDRSVCRGSRRVPGAPGRLPPQRFWRGTA